MPTIAMPAAGPASARMRRVAVTAADLRVGLRERSKQSLELGRLEPDAAVGHGEDEPRPPAGRSLARRGEPDTAAFGELYGIVNQIFERGTQPQWIADHGL